MESNSAKKILCRKSGLIDCVCELESVIKKWAEIIFDETKTKSYLDMSKNTKMVIEPKTNPIKGKKKSIDAKTPLLDKSSLLLKDTGRLEK